MREGKREKSSRENEGAIDEKELRKWRREGMREKGDRKGQGKREIVPKEREKTGQHFQHFVLIKVFWHAIIHYLTWCILSPFVAGV